MSRSRTRREDQRARRRSVRAILAPKLPQPLVAAWRHACWAFRFICDFHTTPQHLAGQGWLLRSRHRVLNDVVRHLELLARRIVLAAALALNFILKPRVAKKSGARKSRRILIWPGNPGSWPTRFQLLPRAPRHDGARYKPPRAPSRFAPTLPLARRLESVRRVLASPDAHVRRLAIRLTRIAQRNLTSNAPRSFDLRPWMYQWGLGKRTPGARLINTGMRLAQGLAEDRLDRFNEASEPG